MNESSQYTLPRISLGDLHYFQSKARRGISLEYLVSLNYMHRKCLHVVKSKKFTRWLCCSCLEGRLLTYNLSLLVDPTEEWQRPKETGSHMCLCLQREMKAPWHFVRYAGFTKNSWISLCNNLFHAHEPLRGQIYLRKGHLFKHPTVSGMSTHAWYIFRQECIGQVQPVREPICTV